MKVTLRLLRMLAPFRWWVVLGILLGFATIGASVGLMAVSAYLISKAALVTSVTDLAIAITGVRFFAISRAVLRYAERVVTHTATFRILTRLRVWFYTGIEPLAPAGLQGYHSGDLLTRIVADVETLENFYIRVVVPPLVAALVTALACWLLGSFDVRLGLALLVFLALTGVGLPLLARWLSRDPAEGAIQARAGLTAALVDEIQGLADVLAYGREDAGQARALELTRALNRVQERLALVRGLGEGLAALFTGLAALTVLWLAIPLVSGGRLDGVYLALLPLAAIASFEAVQPLGQAAQYLEAGQAAARRLFELIDARPMVAERPAETLLTAASGPVEAKYAKKAPAVPARDGEGQPDAGPKAALRGDYSLEIAGLRFAYAAGEPPVLDGLDLSVPSGGRVALVGPSGSGKTTLVNLLVRFWDYQEGHIRLGGRELHTWAAEDVRALLSVVSQETHLFNTTVRDNLRLANGDATGEQIMAACRQAQIHDFIESLPGGYDTWVGENGVRLSGGERQRLAIARAILKDAPIVILDEATAHLDTLTEAKIWDALETFMQGRTCLIITHGRAGLAHADQVLKLDQV